MNRSICNRFLAAFLVMLLASFSVGVSASEKYSINGIMTPRPVPGDYFPTTNDSFSTHADTCSGVVYGNGLYEGKQIKNTDELTFFECEMYLRNLAFVGDFQFFGVKRDQWVHMCKRPIGGGYIVVLPGQACPSSALILMITRQGLQNIRPAGTGGIYSVEFLAKVVDGESPKAGVTLQFTVDTVASSGGHNHHDSSRPKGIVAPANGITDARGEIRFNFSATQIAGVHSITATCNDCSNKTAQEKITVKVPDLVNIFTLPYRDAQWAYPGIGQTSQHSDQHYLTVAAAFRILDISRKFQKIWPTAPKLTLNDASLVWGGKFDISGSWEQNPRAHAEHRVGDNIDIRANTAPGAVPANIRAVVLRWLGNDSLPEDNISPNFLIDSVRPLREGIGTANEHFHLRLGN